MLALLGDSITTDHISPAGSIKADTPAGKYLIAQGVSPKDFNSYGARRGNHEVMMRGTFANVRLRNQLAPGTEGGWTILPARWRRDVDLSTRRCSYRAAGVPLVVLAGKEYGSGSSRDWAAKGTMLLGVKAVIAESFERIHRSNLVNMGVLPLEFRRRHVGRVARPHRQGSVRLRWFGRGADATIDPDGRCDARGRHDVRLHGPRARRHAGGTDGVPARRDPAVRAEATCRS